MFLSILWRPTYSIFTGPQRLFCLMAAFSLNMTISAMWFNTNSSPTAAYEFKFGFVSITYLQVFVGAIATALTVPLIIILDAVFRYRKSKIKSDAMRLERITSNGCLPHWMSYVGYILCTLAIVSGFLVPFFYSLQWGKDTSNNWLMSVYFGTLADMTLGPLKVCKRVIEKFCFTDYMYT